MDLNLFGLGTEFDHIGIAVSSIDQSFKKIPDPIQKVCVAFTNIHGFKVELVEPFGEDSPVTELLKKSIKTYHICFRVKDVHKAIEKAKDSGFYCIAKPVPAKAFEGRKVAWLFSGTYGLIELLEE